MAINKEKVMDAARKHRDKGQVDATANDAEQRPGDHDARILEAWVENEQGAPVETLSQGEPYTFRVRVEFLQSVSDPAFTMIFYNDQWNEVFVATTAFEGERQGRFEQGERAVFSVSLDCWFAPGRYLPAAIVAHPGSGTDVIDRWDRVLNFLVVGTRATGGLVDLPHVANVTREIAARAT